MIKKLITVKDDIVMAPSDINILIKNFQSVGIDPIFIQEGINIVDIKIKKRKKVRPVIKKRLFLSQDLRTQLNVKLIQDLSFKLGV